MKKLRLAFVFTSLFFMFGCSEKTANEYIAIAEAKAEQNDISTAIIELKNAVKVDTSNAKARFLLGQLYASQGSSAAAEKELTRALDLGYETNKVLPILANVYSLQFKHNEIVKLVNESRILDPEVSTSLLIYKALAYFQLDEPYKAKQAVLQANEISSDSLYSRLGVAYVDFSNEQIETSLEKIDEILEAHPDFADAHLLKGQLTTASNDSDAAVESYEKYKELLPNTYQARLLLADAYIKNQQFIEAEKELDLLLRVNKEQPYVNQLKALSRFASDDFDNAKLFMEKAIQNGADNAPNKIIAGVSAFRLGSHELAYEYLNSIRNELPAQHPVFRMLAVLELKLGNGDDAGLTLVELDGLSEDDIILLSAASAQLMREGKKSQAKSILEKVNSIEFKDPLRMAQRGMLRLSLDDIDGITDLEEALFLDPDQNTANTALARVYIENGLFDKALDLSQTWIEQKPQEVFGYILAAVSYANLTQINSAESMYDKALEIEPTNIAANTYYADKANDVGDKLTAIAFLNTVISANPEHLPTLRRHFVLQQQLGNIKQGLRPIESAFNRATEKLQLRILFGQALFSVEKYNECIGVLGGVSPSSELPEVYWVVLGNAYYNNKQRERALSLVKAWISQKPDSKSAHLRLIALQELYGQNEKALQVAIEAQTKFPNDPQFTLLTIYFNIVLGDLKSAERSFAGLTDELRNTVEAQGLLGQILLEREDAKSALPKLKSFYEQKNTQRNAALVAKALKELGLYAQAITFLQDHQRLEGQSITNDIQIAELAIVSGNTELAKNQYLRILEEEPTNSRALNNLAYLLIEQGDAESALPYAERAAALNPEYVPILDTYGTNLFKVGQFKQASKVYATAFELDKNNLQVAIRFAEAMIAAKQFDQAKRVLNKLSTKDEEMLLRINQLKSEI